MGRPESAVAADTKEAEALAKWLRAQRERRGLTYAAMATRTECRFTASALSRGASGRIPSLPLVEAFARACDADVDQAVRLWKAARKAREERRRRAGISPEFRDLAFSVRSALTHHALVDTFGQLHGVMVEMRARHGQRSLSALQELAGRTPDGRNRLPKSSLSVILRGEAVPSREHLTAFMEAMDLPPDAVRCWQRVWDRISEAERPPPAAEMRAFLIDTVQPDRPPWHETDAFPMLELEDHLDLQRGQITLTAANLGRQKGPRPARPAAGITRAGLPIRTPRRYHVQYGPVRSPMGFITLQPREVTVQLPPNFAAGTSQPVSSPPRIVTANGVRVGRPPRPAVLGSIGRAIERILPMSSRTARTRWPNF